METLLCGTLLWGSRIAFHLPQTPEDVFLYLLLKKWFIIWRAPLSYGCTREVGRSRKKRKFLEEIATLDFFVPPNFPSVSITQWSTPNHEPFLLYHRIRHKTTENKLYFAD